MPNRTNFLGKLSSYITVENFFASAVSETWYIEGDYIMIKFISAYVWFLVWYSDGNISFSG